MPYLLLNQHAPRQDCELSEEDNATDLSDADDTIFGEELYFDELSAVKQVPYDLKTSQTIKNTPESLINKVSLLKQEKVLSSSKIPILKRGESDATLHEEQSIKTPAQEKYMKKFNGKLPPIDTSRPLTTKSNNMNASSVKQESVKTPLHNLNAHLPSHHMYQKPTSSMYSKALSNANLPQNISKRPAQSAQRPIDQPTTLVPTYTETVYRRQTSAPLLHMDRDEIELQKAIAYLDVLIYQRLLRISDM